MWNRLRNLFWKRADDLGRSAQKRGLAAAASIARRFLGEPAPEEDWAAWEYRTLDAVLHRMCDYDPQLPRPADTIALESILEFVDTFPEPRRRQIRQILAIFEAGSQLLGPNGRHRRFTELDDDAADVYLRSWEQSRLPPRRAVFRALKSICMVGYWSQPETWGSIGYSLEQNPGLDTP